MRDQYRSILFNPSRVVFMVLLGSICLLDAFALARNGNTIEDDLYRNRVLQQIDSLLEAKYVLPEKAGEYASEFRKRYESGIYGSCTNSTEFADQITADLVRITNDRHFKCRVIEPSEMGEDTESSLHHPVRYHVLGIDENKGFFSLEWLEGNIGYLDIRRFYNAPDVRDMIVGAINFLSGANAIIVDLRENGGGSGDYLSSYFLEYPTQLTGSYSREDDFLTEFWTAKDIGAKRLTEVPLFLLTSKRTFSASESFAYDMQVRKRATIVGDSTRGGAHSVDLYKIDDQFEIYIPTARAINPVTGTNWEGTGVVPDILVPSEAALDTAIVMAKAAGEEFARTRGAELKQAVREMEAHMDRAETLFRDNKEDEAGVALDKVFDMAEECNLINEFFVDVLAYNYRSPENKRILYAILKKKIDLFPKSPTAYESLAYAYYKYGDEELAIGQFERVLELAPDNRNAMKMIERIRSE